MRNKLSNMKFKAIKNMNSLTSISSRTLAITLRRTFLRISLAYVSQQELNATYLIDYLRVKVSVSANLRVDFTASSQTERLLLFLLPISSCGLQLNYGLVSQYTILYSFILRFDSFFSLSLIKVKLTKVNFTTCTLEKCRINSTTKNLARDLD